MEVIVVANHKRKPLIVDHLQGIEHTIHYTTDYDLPEGWKPKPGNEGLIQRHERGYRCFRGHQDAHKLIEGQHALILEDDAVPNRSDWLDVVTVSESLIDGFELVSLHSRGYDLQEYDRVSDWDIGELRFFVPRIPRTWIVATLAYIIRKDAVDLVGEAEFDGFPLDLWVYRRLNYCLLHPSPFNHDMREGSLID